MAEQAAVLVGRRKGAEIGDLVFDVTISERHSAKAQATNNPVEDGSVIGDHVTQIPDELSINGLWTDTPSELTEAQLNRSVELYQSLLALKEAGDPVQVVTGLKVYPVMVITAVDTVRDASTGFSVPVAVSLKQINVASSKTELIPAPEDQPDGAKKKKEKGRQKPSEAGEETEKESSVLFDLLYG